MPVPDDLRGDTRCHASLADLGLDWRILRPGVPMPTVASAAEAIGVAPGEIAKTVVFTDPDGGVVVAVASGPARIDPGLLAAAVGRARLRLADQATVLAATGYEAGGVAPVGHRGEHPIVVDRTLATMTTVYAGGGEHDLLLAVDVASLIAVTGAVVADIAVVG